MFATQETAEVSLLCENDSMKFVIDQFGSGVRTKPIGKDHFRATVTVCLSPNFFRWVFGWDGQVIIEGPEAIKAKYKEMLQKELEKY